MTAVIFLILRIGLAAALYAFLWIIFRAIWRELSFQSTVLSSQKRPALQVIVRQTDGSEKRFLFQQDEITVGRAPSCSISLTDDKLSGTHARIAYHHSQWWLEDLGSKNGTYLGQDPIKTPTVVISGDEFKCGNSTFALKIDSNIEYGGKSV